MNSRPRKPVHFRILRKWSSTSSHLRPSSDSSGARHARNSCVSSRCPGGIHAPEHTAWAKPTRPTRWTVERKRREWIRSGKFGMKNFMFVHRIVMIVDLVDDLFNLSTIYIIMYRSMWDDSTCPIGLRGHLSNHFEGCPSSKDVLNCHDCGGFLFLHFGIFQYLSPEVQM